MELHLSVYKWDGVWHAEIRQRGEVMWAVHYRSHTLALAEGLNAMATWSKVR